MEEDQTLIKLDEVYWVTWREMKRYIRSKAGIIIRLIQPVVWLGFMGNIFSGTRALLESVGFAGAYVEYITPGVIAMTVLFSSIFGGMNTLWDRRLGFFQKILTTPIKRSSLAVGKILALALISAIQCVSVLGIALALGVNVGSGLLGVVGIVLVVMIVASGFASISVVVGTTARSQEAFWGIINFLGMPLLFVSSALFPLRLMPAWLASTAMLNPLTYAIDAIRSFMAPSYTGMDVNILVDFAVIGIFSAITISISTSMFNREVKRAL